MAAPMRRVCGAALRWTSMPIDWSFPRHENLLLRNTPVFWKQPTFRTLFNDKRKLHTAAVGHIFRLRPFHFLVATGGGYAGYRKYENYKVEQLEKMGLEVPAKLAREWEVPAILGLQCCHSVKKNAN